MDEQKKWIEIKKRNNIRTLQKFNIISNLNIILNLKKCSFWWFIFKYFVIIIKFIQIQ